MVLTGFAIFPKKISITFSSSNWIAWPTMLSYCVFIICILFLSYCIYNVESPQLASGRSILVSTAGFTPHFSQLVVAMLFLEFHRWVVS